MKSIPIHFNKTTQTVSKLPTVLLTWRTGRANGKELFGVVPQVTIERGVWGGDSGQVDVRSRRWKSAHRRGSQLFHPRIRVLQPTSGFYSGSGQISKSQVLSELEFTLGQKERALQANPYDSVSQNHLNAYNRYVGFLQSRSWYNLINLLL